MVRLSLVVPTVIISVLLGGQSFAGQRLRQPPDLLLLQGPGADIQAVVAVVPAEQRPPGSTGVVVEHVTRGGPADAAGLRRGDIVTEFDAIAITDPVQFRKVVRDTAPGRRVKAIVWRDGTRREIFVAPVPGRLE